jgi:sec-independent protein translocase protein TatA
MHTIALVTPGPTEWVLILVIVIILFGAKKIPELARSLGQSMKLTTNGRFFGLDEFAHNDKAPHGPIVVQPVPLQQPANYLNRAH